MTLERFSDKMIDDWREAVERTPVSPGPAGGPEYVATTDQAIGNVYLLRSGDLFVPLLKGATRAAVFFGSELYEGVQTNSFLGGSQLDSAAITCLEELPHRSTVLLHLPVQLYKGLAADLRRLGYYPLAPFYYHKVVLTSSFDEWFMRPAVKRIQVRKAKRKGVTAKIGGEELLDDFYRMYLASFERWQAQSKATSCHPKERFQRMFDMPGSGMRIALAEFEGRVIGAGLVCSYRRTAAGLYGGIDYEHRNRKPSNLLYAELLRILVRDGITEYNMGTSNNLKNVETFKESLGAVKYESVILCRHRFPRLQRFLNWLRATDRGAVGYSDGGV